MRRFVTLTVTAFASNLVAAQPGNMSAESVPVRVEPGKSSVAFYDSGGKPDSEKPPASGGAYELRGFFGSGENLEVSVRCAGSARSEWLRVGQKNGDLLVEKADPKAGTATLVVDGRHLALRLAGEAPPEILKVTPQIVVEEKKSSKEEAKAARRAYFESMRANMTADQMAIFSKAMETKMPELVKAHPGLNNDRPPADAEERQKLVARLVPVMHEAAVASSALPGKDGKITPLPANFASMLNEYYMNDKYGEPDAPPAATNAATATLLASGRRIALRLSGEEPPKPMKPDAVVEKQEPSSGDAEFTLNPGTPARP